MTEIAFVNDNHITLRGSWSREHALPLHRVLADLLTQLPEREPAPEHAVLDLSEVRELDACGCQLLVLFMENLRRRGIPPVSCALNEQVTGQIALLGFSDAFPVRDASAKPYPPADALRRSEQQRDQHDYSNRRD